MRRVQFGTHPDLLVGPEHGADAAVYRLSDELVLVQSADLFPPMLPQPHVYGQIAAANALSDIYALGARPVVALNLLCSVKGTSFDTLAEILDSALAGGVRRGCHWR